MALSKTEIQKRSDERRGVKIWGTKLPIDFISRLKTLSAETGKPQSTIVREAVEQYEERLKEEGVL